MNENLFGYACQLLFTCRNNNSLTLDEVFFPLKIRIIMKCQELKPNILCLSDIDKLSSED